MKFLLALFSSFIYFLGFGQNVSEFPLKESSLLWKIEGNGLTSESYLFGTMHMIEKEYFVFPPKLEKLVKKSDALMMELAGLPNQLEALKYVTLKEGSFFDYFTKEQTDSILTWAKKDLNMSEDVFRRTMKTMKPFVVVQLATQMQFMGKTESYEVSFEKIATDHKIDILGLETIEQQMSIFDNLSDEDQVEMVMSTIRDPKKSIKTTTEMEKLYVGQNVDSLFLYINQEGGYIEDNQAIFLDDRNKNWIPKIQNEIKTKKTFIAVGAGHLGGPQGLIRLLQKEGYTVTPIEL